MHYHQRNPEGTRMIRYPGIKSCDIYLPSEDTDVYRWAVIACDQFTSQPEYWNRVTEIVGNAPSALKIMQPEVFLDRGDRSPEICSEMQRYLDEGILVKRVEDGFIAVERTTHSGKRLGMVCALDLECYDFRDMNHMVRATEDTVTDRLPARIAIREKAAVEMPHVMVLIDDPDRTVIEPLFENTDSVMLYDTELMEGGGHIRGWAVTSESEKQKVSDALFRLLERSDGFLYAAGDGNHSLAAAKMYWEEKKKAISPEEAENDPARFVLVELVNLYSEALIFRPVHRLVKGCSMDELLTGFKGYLAGRNMCLTEGEDLIFVSDGTEENYSVEGSGGKLPVAILQDYLDRFASSRGGIEMDYIHGDDDLKSLCKDDSTVGILLKIFNKMELFPGVRAGGNLPRKTFSMGDAREKRYYMECRKLR